MIVTKKKRIQWNDKEWEAIARRLANYLIDNPGVSLLVAYKNVVDDVLPSERQRTINNVNVFNPIIDRIRELMKAKKEAPKKPPELVEKVIVLPPDIKELSLEDLHNEIYRRQFEPLLESMVDRIVDKIVLRTSDKCKDKLSKVGKTDKPDKHKVLIVGLLGGQQQKIKDDFDGIYDIRFHSKDTSDHNLKSAAANCDEVILMTKFISHSSQNVVKSLGIRVTLCHGGLTELSKLLEASFMNGS